MTVVFVNPVQSPVGEMMYVFDNEGRTNSGTRHWVCWAGVSTDRRAAMRDGRVGDNRLDAASLQWIRLCRDRIDNLIRTGEVARML